ncbi:unnamed protein product [Parajaminaea phylloscopi]
MQNPNSNPWGYEEASRARQLTHRDGPSIGRLREAASSALGSHEVRTRVAHRASQSREYWTSVKESARQRASSVSDQVKVWREERELSKASDAQAGSSQHAVNNVAQPGIRPSLSKSASAGVKTIKHAFSSTASDSARQTHSQRKDTGDEVFPVLLPGYTFARPPLGVSPDEAEDELHVVLRGFVGRKSSAIGKAQRMFNLMARQLARLPKPLAASSTAHLLQAQPSSTHDAHFFPSVPRQVAADEAGPEQPQLSEKVLEEVTDHISSETLGKVINKLGVLPIDGEGGVHDEHHHGHDRAAEAAIDASAVQDHGASAQRSRAPIMRTQSKDLEADLHESMSGPSSSASSVSTHYETPPYTRTAASTLTSGSGMTGLSEVQTGTQSRGLPRQSSSKLHKLRELTPLSSTSLASSYASSSGTQTTSDAASVGSQLVGGSTYWARRTLDEIHQLTENLNERLADFWMYRVPYSTLRIEIEGRFSNVADTVTKGAGHDETSDWRTILAQELKTDIQGMYRLKVNMGPLAVFGGNMSALRCRAVLLGSSPLPVSEKTTEWVPLPLPPNANVMASKSTGPSVRLISDIDDTVRLTNVTQGLKSVFRQVFVLPHHETEVAGMSEWYNHLVSGYKVGVHFVSNAPVELWKPLRQFLHVCGMPEGSHLHLKSYNSEVEAGVTNTGSGSETAEHAKVAQPPKTSLLSAWLQPASQRKRGAILSILDDFPDTLFFLVGDTGELDLELYVELAKDRPHQIKALFLRDVSSPPFVEARPAPASSSAGSLPGSPQIVAWVKEAARKKVSGSNLGDSSDPTSSRLSSAAPSPALFSKSSTHTGCQDPPSLLNLGDPLLDAGGGVNAFSSSKQHRFGFHTTSPALQTRIARAKALLDPTQTELHFFRRGDDEVRSESLRILRRLLKSSSEPRT